jgi:putative membrane protein
MLRITLAALHLLALAIGFAAVLARGASLRKPPSADGLRRTFHFDAEWGIAAALWIGTGLWRYLGETEKSTAYYNANHLFLTKMGLLVLILVLEVWPMITLIRWRRALGRGTAPDAVAPAGTASRLATISFVQAALVVVMVFLAAGMARGYGARG